MNFRGDRTTPNRKNIINERKVLKEIKDKLKNDIKNKNTKNNKTHKPKNISSSYRYPLTSMEDNNLILDNNDSNNYKSRTCKKGKDQLNI